MKKKPPLPKVVEQVILSVEGGRLLGDMALAGAAAVLGNEGRVIDPTNRQLIKFVVEKSFENMSRYLSLKYDADVRIKAIVKSATEREKQSEESDLINHIKKYEE